MDDKGRLPINYATSTPSQRRTRRPYAFIFLILIASISYSSIFTWQERSSRTVYTRVPLKAQTFVDKCSGIRINPSPPPDFYNREVSDRYDASLAPKNPIVIRNATIWTGEVTGGDIEVVHGDVLFDKGIVKAVGKVEGFRFEGNPDEINVNGAWVTAGIFDLHSHLGVSSSPGLSGSADTNSHNGITQPWLRSLDGLNTHDEAYRLSVAGGVTSVVVLPGSANAIGGQAFPIKLRPTSEKSSSSKLIEPSFQSPTYWRHLKQACGENPSNAYDGTRMDTIWAFRAAYDEARQLKEKQDEFCGSVESGRWDLLQNTSFPEDLKLEALVDVLRGKVKIYNHCYEAVDLDGIVRLSNEFNFTITSFHHAHEAFLVPDLLKKMFGRPPFIAMFDVHGRIKREAYRGSEYAPKVLADNGIEVVMKSDHPVTNSRYLLQVAQQAHYYGLPARLALMSITTTPARAAGLDHRLGKVKAGYDADLVIWDAHPLSLGATPRQVFIDGIPQLHQSPSPTLPLMNENVFPDPRKNQSAPATPSFEEEADDAVAFDGLPPLEPKKVMNGTVVFSNTKSWYRRVDGKVVDLLQYASRHGNVAREGVKILVRNGEIVCVGVPTSTGGVRGDVAQELKEAGVKICDTKDLRADVVDQEIDLEGGSMAPGLSSFGTTLGLQHIANEGSTGDGLSKTDTVEGTARTADGIWFGTRTALLAYRSGVTVGITPPIKSPGLILAFGTGAQHKLQQGAVIARDTGLHLTLTMSGSASIGSQIRSLRNNLAGAINATGSAFKRVVDGEIPLIVSVESADVIATLIELKKEVEDLLVSKGSKNQKLRVTLAGASEAHLLASEIAQAGIGVIVGPKPFPESWESLRILPGPPLSEKSFVSTLLNHNVTVAIGSFSATALWISRNLRWDTAWVALESQGSISKAQALELATTNLESLLGLDVKEIDESGDYVATKGGELLEFEGKVFGIVSRRRGVVDIF